MKLKSRFVRRAHVIDEVISVFDHTAVYISTQSLFFYSRWLGLKKKGKKDIAQKKLRKKIEINITFKTFHTLIVIFLLNLLPAGVFMSVSFNSRLRKIYVKLRTF